MLTLSWTRPVVDAGQEGHGGPTREKLWQALLHKAEHPTDYVPAIAECRIHDRYADGLLREIRRGQHTFLQRVTAQESAGRIVYRYLDHTDITEIRNEIGEDGEGRLTLTLSITLTEDRTAAVLEQNPYLRHLDDDFHGTLDAMTAVLRQVSTEPGTTGTRTAPPDPNGS
ncbi:AtaL-like protein [Streptomyces sp. NBC_01264]|uniref:AtaL-like protein n=1 Tax=Streptomyces sp. NBC_01264 TaxID=2903804 RepID=UPI002258DA1E|nr:AtaL-like protein [Streptomyces sp. NBC_01264]MCX4779710.1 SRPBCC family protein [Streptomyces sp. NBC_01264]